MNRFLIIALILICGQTSAQDLINTTVTDSTITFQKKTTIVDEYEIDGKVFSGFEDTTRSGTVKAPAKVITVETIASILRVRCHSAKVMELGDGRYAVATPGDHVLEILALDFEKQLFDEIDLRVVVGNGPNPPPVDPVKPVEPPKTEAPIKGPGFQVLLVFETADFNSYPRAQQKIFASREIKSYLDAKCIQQDGVAAWRAFDKDTQFPSGVGQNWNEALKRKRGRLPWVIISTGETGYEGPLPGTVAESLELLKKYGGAL